MANKGFMKLWKKINGGKHVKTESEIHEEQFSKEMKLTQDRVREMTMNQILADIQESMDSKKNKLPKEMIDALGIRSAVNRARYQFCEHPVITDQDMSEIDEHIKFVIYEIQRAIEQGNQTAARWGAVALAAAIETLHVEIKGNDLKYAQRLMEERNKYARNLELLVQNALQYDWYTQELSRQAKRYEQMKNEVNELTAAVQKKLNTPEGAKAMVQIKKSGNDVTKLTSETAKQLRNDLNNLHMSQKSLIGRALAVDTASEEQKSFATQLEECRNHVAIYPRVSDPDLLAKNQAANEAYVADMQRRMNTVELMTKSIENYLNQLATLGKHAIFQDQAAKAIEMEARLRLIELQEKEEELEAARALRKQKEQGQVIKQMQKNIQAEIERLNELEEEEETEDEEEDEVETEPLTEPEEVEEEDEEELECEDVE